MTFLKIMAVVSAVAMLTVASSSAAEARAKVKKPPQNQHRVIRDVTPLYAANVDVQELSARRRRHASRRHRGGGSSVSLSGIVAPQLVAKAREIMAACGSIVVSARSARGNRSNHPIGRAVDMKGNPSCIYAHLQGWPGGKSRDYASAPGGPHVHISYNPGGQEWGLTFSHNHRSGVRYASRRHRSHKRFAAAGP